MTYTSKISDFKQESDDFLSKLKILSTEQRKTRRNSGE